MTHKLSRIISAAQAQSSDFVFCTSRARDVWTCPEETGFGFQTRAAGRAGYPFLPIEPMMGGCRISHALGSFSKFGTPGCCANGQ